MEDRLMKDLPEPEDLLVQYQNGQITLAKLAVEMLYHLIILVRLVQLALVRQNALDCDLADIYRVLGLDQPSRVHDRSRGVWRRRATGDEEMGD